MAQNSGFFDALQNSAGVYDRTYSAADYCDNLATVIKNGVVKTAADGANDLQVTADNENMTITISTGRAWINGHYYYNDSPLVLDITTAPVANPRLDRVILRLNTATAIRSIEAAILTGTATQTPTPPDLTRNGDIYEICIANVNVGVGVTTITNDAIEDTRGDNSVCGWAASVSPAVMTLLQQFVWNKTLTNNAQSVAFNIPQYNANLVQILDVYTNGVLEVAGVDYTLNNNVITFATEKTAGTEITVVLQKSIDTEGIETVLDEITELQNAVAALESDNEYIYKCNGVNDNVVLCNLVDNFITAANDNATIKIRVIGGNFGIAAPMSGTGAQSIPYTYFSIGSNITSRRAIIDFANAGQINVPITAGSYNNIFNISNCIIENADIVANQTAANTSIIMFKSFTPLKVVNSRFWINASLESYIAQTGTFENCRGSVTTGAANVYCFKGISTGLLRVNGGEYYAYNGSGSNNNAVVYNAESNAVIILYAVNMPTVARSGYQQINAVLTTTGKVSITDTITTLTISATGANIRGTLAINKNGLM